MASDERDDLDDVDEEEAELDEEPEEAAPKKAAPKKQPVRRAAAESERDFAPAARSPGGGGGGGRAVWGILVAIILVALLALAYYQFSVVPKQQAKKKAEEMARLQQLRDNTLKSVNEAVAAAKAANMKDAIAKLESAGEKVRGAKGTLLNDDKEMAAAIGDLIPIIDRALSDLKAKQADIDKLQKEQQDTLTAACDEITAKIAALGGGSAATGATGATGASEATGAASEAPSGGAATTSGQ